jgi:Ca2+-dependent lipid-binding protein
MWPNLFIKNEFSCIATKSKYTTKSSNVDSLSPKWNEYFWLPVNSYDDTMQLGIKASSMSRSNILFMTEMEEKLILKDYLPSSWSI